MQTAHFVDGLRIVELAVLTTVAAGIGVEPDAFASAIAHLDLEAHIDQTRRRMHDAGLQGVSALVLEAGSRRMRTAHDRFHGDPQSFVKHVEARPRGCDDPMRQRVLT